MEQTFYVLEIFPIFTTIESKPNKGKLGNNVDTFNVDAESDVILTGLYPQKDYVIARFYKAGDQTPITTIHLEKKGAKMVETNLDGKFIKNIDIKIDFKSWQIKTIKIK